MSKLYIIIPIFNDIRSLKKLLTEIGQLAFGEETAHVVLGRPRLGHNQRDAVQRQEEERGDSPVPHRSRPLATNALQMVKQ